MVTQNFNITQTAYIIQNILTGVYFNLNALFHFFMCNKKTYKFSLILGFIQTTGTLA